jgi:hypothetical protein
MRCACTASATPSTPNPQKPHQSSQTSPFHPPCPVPQAPAGEDHLHDTGHYRRRRSGAARYRLRPLGVLIEDFTATALEEALRDGPYGRCVYACDNDVVDHQVVALEYPGAITATFTMTAFCPAADRRTRLFGPRESLASHLAVFAAERARRAGTVETLSPAFTG